MIKKIKQLFLLCLFTQTSFLICKINLEEFNSSVISLAEYYNLQNSLKEEPNPIEAIEITMWLLEKASHDLVAEKFSQKIYTSLHKYLPILTHAITFEKNYTKITDFAEELFKCEINLLDKKMISDESQPQLTPFRYPICYAILALSKIALLKEQNPNQEFPSEQLEALKTKLRQNFKNAFYKEKISLKKHHNITSKNINELCDAIELLIPTKKNPSVINPANWNFTKIGAVVGIACGITLTVYLAKLLASAKKATDKIPEEINDLKSKVSEAIGTTQPNPEHPGFTATLVQTMGTLKASLTGLMDAATNLIGEGNAASGEATPLPIPPSPTTPPRESTMAPAAAQPQAMVTPAANPPSASPSPARRARRTTIAQLVETYEATGRKIGQTFDGSEDEEAATIPQVLGEVRKALKELTPIGVVALAQLHQRASGNLLRSTPNLLDPKNQPTLLARLRAANSVAREHEAQKAQLALTKGVPTSSPSSASPSATDGDDKKDEEIQDDQGGQEDEEAEEAEEAEEDE